MLSAVIASFVGGGATSRMVVDEGLTPIKDGGTCLRRLSMFRKEVH